MIGRRNSLLLTSTSPLTFSRPIISPSFPDDFSATVSADYFSYFSSTFSRPIISPHFSRNCSAGLLLTFLHISPHFSRLLLSTCFNKHVNNKVSFIFIKSCGKKKRYNNFPSFLRFFPPLAEPSDSSVKDKPGG